MMISSACVSWPHIRSNSVRCAKYYKLQLFAPQKLKFIIGSLRGHRFRLCQCMRRLRPGVYFKWDAVNTNYIMKQVLLSHILFTVLYFGSYHIAPCFEVTDKFRRASEKKYLSSYRDPATFARRFFLSSLFSACQRLVQELYKQSPGVSPHNYTSANADHHDRTWT